MSSTFDVLFSTYILLISFRCKEGGILREFWDYGDFRDVPVIDALGASTLNSGWCSHLRLEADGGLR